MTKPIDLVEIGRDRSGRPIYIERPSAAALAILRLLIPIVRLWVGR